MTQPAAVREVRAAQGEQGAAADNLGRRPLLRGWLHLGVFVAWLIGGPFLIAAGPDAGSKAALTVYVLSMLTMFGVSALFHRVRWSAPAWRRMRRADHSAIFIGIAGTSTAVAGLALSGWSQALMLSMVWAGACAGIVLRQVWLDAPQWAVAVPYVVVGWCSLIVAPQLVRSLGWVGFALMLIAGLFYTAGALGLRPQAAGPVAGHVRVSRGVPCLHRGGGGTLRLSHRVHRPPALLSHRVRDVGERQSAVFVSFDGAESMVAAALLAGCNHVGRLTLVENPVRVSMQRAIATRSFTTLFSRATMRTCEALEIW